MMDGIKNGVGGRVVVVEDDMGDGMLCVNHPYRNNPGGICAFCLQEKLGKLVSSSFPLPIRASSTSSASSPPSFRSETTNAAVSGGGVGGIVGSTSSMSVVRPMSNEECYTRKATRIPFLLAKKKKITVASSSDYHHHHHHGYGHGGGNIAFKRSKSTSAPIRGRFLDGGNGGDFSPRKRSGFWSFLYLSSTTHSSKKLDKVAASSVAPPPPPVTTTATGGASSSSSSSGCIVQKRKPKEKSLVIIEDDDSPNNEATPSAASSTTSFERKVSRSRSVGCGSRSFSGDFFERISTGLGDCTLRRVESQREGKPKSTTSSASGATVAASTMKERVKCGGIFGGFIITSSSSSSSSSSYWLSSSAEDHHNVNGRSNKSWGWALTSPMRAFTKPSSGKKDSTAVIRESNNKNTSSTTTPNLAAIPSLLTVRV